jgi:hypothetical protein
MGGFEGSIHPKLKSMGFSSQVYPLTFYVVNDGSKPNPILIQIMGCVIYHSVCPNYSAGSTIKRRKGMISYK